MAQECRSLVNKVDLLTY